MWLLKRNLTKGNFEKRSKAGKIVLFAFGIIISALRRFVRLVQAELGRGGLTKYLFARIHLKDEWLGWVARVGQNSIIVVMDLLRIPGAAARLQS